MKIVFVYNANSNPLSRIINAGHKIIQPKTYSCNLCKLTHGSFGEKKAWKDFCRNKDVTLHFMYEDEFKLKTKEKISAPLVYHEKKNAISIVLNSDELKEVDDLGGLILKIDKYIRENN